MTLADKVEYLACWLYLQSFSVCNEDVVLPTWGALGEDMRSHYLKISIALLRKNKMIFEGLFDESKRQTLEKH